jgi:nucleolar protein 56
MEIRAWFGDVCQGEFLPAKSLEEMISHMGEPFQAEVQPDLRSLAIGCGAFKGDEEYNQALRSAAIALVRRRLKAAANAEEDMLQMVEALDDMNSAVNLLDERLYEWSRLYKEEVVHGKGLAESLSGQKGIGELAETLLYLRDSRRRLEEEIGTAAAKIAPNLSDIAGPVLAARLISRAGSLKRLSEMPSSTIQIMGAEKSLFKHLKGKAPSPKHGIIYRHPAVIGAPRRLRGRAARALSGKLALASRLDYHRGELVPELKDSLEKRLAEVRRLGSRAGKKGEKP